MLFTFLAISKLAIYVCVYKTNVRDTSIPSVTFTQHHYCVRRLYSHVLDTFLRLCYNNVLIMCVCVCAWWRGYNWAWFT